MYISMAVSLLHGLKVDFGLKWSRSKSFNLFLKCHFDPKILLSTSNPVLSFAWSIALEVETKLSPLDNKDILETENYAWTNGQYSYLLSYGVIYYSTILPHYLLHLTYYL